MVEFNFDTLSIASVVYLVIVGVCGTSLNAFAIRKAIKVNFGYNKRVDSFNQSNSLTYIYFVRFLI